MRGRQVFATAIVVSVVACTSEARSQDTWPQPFEHSASPHDTAADSVIENIAFSGLRRIPSETVQLLIASRAGEKFDSTRIERDVRDLARLGWFDAIQVEVEDATDTSHPVERYRVRLILHVEERAFLSKVEYSGSRLLSRQQIDKLLAEKKVAPKVGEPENQVISHRIAVEIQSALADLGHPYARVAILRHLSPNATLVVQFKINEGPHRPLGRVSFEGHPQFSPKLLRHQMQRLTPGAIFAGLRERDSYTRAAFEEDRERLLAYYQNHGFREARIGDARVSSFQANARRWLPWPHKSSRAQLEVAIPIEAGPLYRVASLETSSTLQRSATFGSRKANFLPELHSGDTYSLRAVENLRRAWQERLQPKRQSHAAAQQFYSVEAIPTLDPTTQTVHIRLDLSPSPPYIVRRLEFLGNSRFPDRYLRSRILLREGMPFDDRVLGAGLARVARTGYFKPIKKEDVHIETNDVTRAVDVSIRIGERGQQRASLVGGRGQFGSTLGIVYTVFNLLDREEVLSSHIEGGPESLQLAMGLAREGFLGSRASLALSVFNTFLRPHLTGSVKGPFFTQQSAGLDATWNYSLTNVDMLSINYDASRSKTQYSPTLPAGITGISVSDVRTESSSHSTGFEWTRDTENQRVVFGNSVSGGWLGGNENLLRIKAEYCRIFRDPAVRRENAWAFHANFGGAGSYSGDMPAYARIISSDAFVRGLGVGELGPDAVISSVSSSGIKTYSALPSGSNLVTSANMEYRVPLTSSTEAAAFFDLGSGLLLPNWLGRARPSLIDSTNGILHGSTGIELRWTLPAISVPLRGYYALNLLRLDQSLLLPHGSLFHAHNRVAAFGWGLGKLF
jgi:outer membrane protein assembly complex protein YaeT